MKRLSGRAAMVTGGGAGIGRATSLRFAAEGAIVVICDIDDEGGQETAMLTKGSLHEAHHVHLDVADNDAWSAAISSVLARYGTVDVLVNNAGLPYRRSLANSPLDEWNRLMAVNAAGTFLGMQHGGKAIAETGGGSIVNVASAAALVGVPGTVSYSATKGAIRAMTRVVATELASDGVRVNAVYPASVRTAMVESDARDAGISVEEFVGAATAMSPLGRMAEPQDVADAVLFLASEEARLITGAELVIDGGTSSLLS